MADDDDPPEDPKARLIWLNEERNRRRKAEREKRASAPTDDGLAQEFADRIESEFRYVEPWGIWLHWTGTHWQPERTRLVWNLARKLCREKAEAHNWRKLADARTIRAVVELGRDDRRIAGTTDMWDTNKWLLNTPGGVVDLKSGKLRPHRRDDFITKITKATPGGECPKWREHLEYVLPDEGSRGVLRRYLGYGLCGSTREHCFMFAPGTGRNGKTTVFGTVRELLGDYAGDAPSNTFVASRQERHPTEMARLQGLRLVTTTETPQGRHWDEEKIKQVTGGDPITARFMGKNFFSFASEFKLVVAGNHKPDLHNCDEAMKARLKLLPFEVTIPEERRKPDFPQQLEAEWGGILADLIQGCLEWQMGGLRPPESVVAASIEYFEQQNMTEQWMKDCCLVAELKDWQATWTGSQQLYGSWEQWCLRRGERPGSLKRFVEALKNTRLFTHCPNSSNTANGFRGVYLLKIPNDSIVPDQ
jgi:putative DNA primase/helicase